MDLESRQAPLAPVRPVTAPAAAGRAALMTSAAAVDLPAGSAVPPAGPAGVTGRDGEPGAADIRVRQAEDAAWQSRKRVELAEKLVGANKSLVIEKDPASAVGFIYKTVDKTTGEVVRVWPQVAFQSEITALADVDARGIMLNARA